MTIATQTLMLFYPPNDSINTSIYMVEHDYLNRTYKVYRQLEPEEYRHRYYNDIQEKSGKIRIFEGAKINTLEDAQRLIAKLWGIECDIDESILFVC